MICYLDFNRRIDCHQCAIEIFKATIDFRKDPIRKVSTLEYVPRDARSVQIVSFRTKISNHSTKYPRT